MQRTEMTKKTARYKGFVALGSLAVTSMLCFFSLYFAIIGLPVTLFFAYRWLQYRAKWGIRF
ncbi:MAG: hypothetical protein VYE40_02290 [Myxococcota bacterium]|jgi:hypothetical protein|nr:hypothetical protein [Myxococcota bacterium]MEC9439912.1 hypothetical protein [Myxococcota bacterium]